MVLNLFIQQQTKKKRNFKNCNNVTNEKETQFQKLVILTGKIKQKHIQTQT